MWLRLRYTVLLNFVERVSALVQLKPRQGRCAEESQSVKVVCLPPPGHMVQPGVTCEITGFGKEKHGELERTVDHS